MQFRTFAVFLAAVSLASATSQNGGSGLLDHPPDRLTSKHCQERRRTCLDHSTLLHCLPVLYKVVPAFTEACSNDTPVCIDNKCVKVLRHKRDIPRVDNECAQVPRRDASPCVGSECVKVPRRKRDTLCVDNECAQVPKRDASPCVGSEGVKVPRRKRDTLCVDNECAQVPRRDASPCVGRECVQVPRRKRDTQPELDLSGVDCKGKSTVCLNCTMTVHCIQSGDKFYPVIPTECSFDTPYCIDGKCGTKDPGRCQVQPPPKSSFNCAEGVEGYLPDPKDCSVYHFCAKKTSYDYKCISDTLAYHQQSAMCKTKNSTTCFQLGCTRPLEYVVYGPDPSVYALCKGTGAAGAILARCPENHTFDISAEQCVRTCKSEGRQPDPDSVYAYFECSRIGNTWKVTPAVCPADAKFDATSQRCVMG